MAEWILMKLCRHDPWVPTTVFTKKTSENVTPGGRRKNLYFHYKKALKNVAQWLEHKSLMLSQ